MKLLVLLSFIVMITVNVLANILPINGVNTGAVSDYYRNLFAPAGLTFSIWGLIYLLLACYVLYQLGVFQDRRTTVNISLLKKTGALFSLSSLANAAWIFAWHFYLIFLSMLLMVVILVCLILINQTIVKVKLNNREKFFIRIPFSVYFGWITVATIANATALLVSLGWDGFGVSEAVWAILVIITGMVIGLATMLKNRDIAYGSVLVWAYLGIMIKHISASGFSGQYPTILTTVILCIVLFIAGEGYLVLSRKRAT